MESHKDSFVDPYAPRRLVLSVPLCCTTKTSSRWRSLRMTSLGGDCGDALTCVGARCARPLQNQTNFCMKRGCTECPPTSLCRSALTQASLVYGVPRNERSRVLGVRVRGGGEPASRRDCFKGKVTFPTNRREQDSRPTLRIAAQPKPSPAEKGLRKSLRRFQGG